MLHRMTNPTISTRCARQCMLLGLLLVMTLMVGCSDNAAALPQNDAASMTYLPIGDTNNAEARAVHIPASVVMASHVAVTTSERAIPISTPTPSAAPMLELPALPNREAQPMVTLHSIIAIAGARYISLEERIAAADVVARVKLNSISADATQSAGVVLYKFDVLEYLKGIGENTLWGVVAVLDAHGDTDQEKIALVHDYINSRDTSWDDREAIVFLSKTVFYTIEGEVSLQQSNHYYLGSVWGGQTTYNINSPNRMWLPAAEPPSQAASTGGGWQLFLLGNHRNAPADQSVSDGPAMTLSELRRLAKDIECEINALGASEEAKLCVSEKYRRQDVVGYYLGELGWDLYRRTYLDFESGMPQGSLIYTTSGSLGWLLDVRRGVANYISRFLAGEVDDDDIASYWLEGRDAELFETSIHDIVVDPNYTPHGRVTYLYSIPTKRPLVSGVYRFYPKHLAYPYNLCHAHPDIFDNTDEWLVSVAAPDGTLHEAFFDPVDFGTAVGANSAHGVLEPASFTYEGAGDITIQSIEWDVGSVRMELDPPNALTGHHIDFIALDGSVSLRLDFGDALSVSDGNAGDVLTWAVHEQPWHSGDLLMLRISRSEPGLTGSIYAATPTATPTPEPTPTATPSPTPTAIPTPELNLTATSASAALTPPAKPLNLTASIQDNSITLTWDDPDDSTITGYLIFRTLGDIQRQLRLIADTTGTPAPFYIDTDIGSGRKYLYRVHAVNDAGESAPSEAVIVEIP